MKAMLSPERDTASWDWIMRIRRRWSFVHVTDKVGWTSSPDMVLMEIRPGAGIPEKKSPSTLGPRARFS